MRESDARRVSKEILTRYLGTWYTWGGNDPGSFDCSGLVLEVAQSVGIVHRSADMTANGLWATTRSGIIDEMVAQPMDWAFWLRNGKAYHVAILWDPISLYVGAEGGGPHVRTVDDARENNAYVKIRPLASRPGATIVNPWGGA